MIKVELILCKEAIRNVLRLCAGPSLYELEEFMLLILKHCTKANHVCLSCLTFLHFQC